MKLLSNWRRHWQYFVYVAKHKWYVFDAGRKLGIPVLASLHDNSKLKPSLFFPYANYFYNPDGTKKQIRDRTGYYKPTDTGDDAFDRAWIAHFHMSKHHWQHWAVPDTRAPGGVKVYEMPMKYRLEMLADWIGAGKAQGTNDLEGWYKANGDKLMLGRETRRFIERTIPEIVARNLHK